MTASRSHYFPNASMTTSARTIRSASSTCSSTSWTLHALGFNGTTPAITGRPSYHPGVMLKIYIYGYLNRVHSSRRLERECQRNVEMMWLTGRLAPDFKTIADFRRDNGAGHPQRMPSFRRTVSRTEAVIQRHGGHRRQQVQGGRTAATETTRPARSTSASSRSRKASSDIST